MISRRGFLKGLLGGTLAGFFMGGYSMAQAAWQLRVQNWAVQPAGPDRVALTLSGHTHGGQIRFGPWAPVVPSRFGQRFDYGYFREGARDLVVSGGLGCSGLPFRLRVPPEITVVDLA